MSSKQIIAIVGATGIQGGSVVKSLLGDSQFALRGLTRDPTKENAQNLASQGVEVVKADISSSEDLKKAFEGAHAVFAVTNFWDHLDQAREIEDGKRIVDAAKAAGVEHFIISSLKNVSELSNGKFTHVQHFDGKAKIQDYVASSGLKWTAFMPGSYYENFQSAFLPRKDESGNYSINVPIKPDTPYHGFSAGIDSGKAVKAILKAGSEAYGKEIYACSQESTLQEYVDGLSKGTGKDIKLNQIPVEMFRSFLPPAIAHEMSDMLEWWQFAGYYGKDADIKASQQFIEKHSGEKLQSWDEFVSSQQWNF